MATLGIFFAFLALFSWGFGDFSIQRATRVVGIWKALVYIGIIGIVLIFPFITGEIIPLIQNPRHFFLLTLTGLVVFFAALFDFEAMRRGKLSIVEPIYSIEVPIAVGLSTLVWGESLSLPQLLLIGAAFLGITIAVTRHHTHLYYHRRIFERGVLLAGLGGIGLGLFNFLVGVSSQLTSPLMTIWFTNCVFTILCLAYLAATDQLRTLTFSFRKHWRIVLSESIFDNAAWIFYAVATTLIPISIAITVSEGYIALAVFLGLFLNREKIQRHQKVGVAIAITSIIFLSAITK